MFNTSNVKRLFISKTLLRKTKRGLITRRPPPTTYGLMVPTKGIEIIRRAHDYSLWSKRSANFKIESKVIRGWFHAREWSYCPDLSVIPWSKPLIAVYMSDPVTIHSSSFHTFISYSTRPIAKMQGLFGRISVFYANWDTVAWNSFTN